MVDSWLVCLGFSVFYFGYFVLASRQTDDDSPLLFGFCVWGTPDTPNQEYGCRKEVANSHVASFSIDCCMTLVVLFLYRKYRRSSKSKSGNTHMLRYFVMIGGIIFVHGILHLLLFVVIDCYVSVNAIPMWLHIIGRFLFTAFTFSLSFVILWMGFLDSVGIHRVVCLSAACTATVLVLTLGIGVDWFLTALFAVSHPLSSFTGWKSTAPQFTQPMGWVFLVATLMGILELSHCPGMYRPIGGHLWYDFWLHIAVIMSLPPFAPPVSVSMM